MKDKGNGSPFGSKIRSRFEYLAQEKKKLLPPPGNYTIKGTFGNPDQTQLGVGHSSNRYLSFGEAKHKMYPLHVDKVEHLHRKSLLAPGPGNYEPPATFGREG